MTNNELFEAMHNGVYWANQTVGTLSRDRVKATHADFVAVRTRLTAALCAAQELERRAAGVPVPKVG